MKYNRLSILAVCLSAFSMVATAQNVTLHKQGGVGQVYEVEKVDSVIYFPVGDAEQFPAPEVENTTTLWDVIKAQPNLKKFAAILEAASYYTGKGKASTGLQFSQLLAGSVPLSVYAPTDAAISEEKFAELQALAKTDGWKLQQEFVFQHISAQENDNAGGDGTKMLNGKIIGLDAIDVTSVGQECNNGKLYTVPSCLPYLANMKEYLFDLAPGCAVAQQFMAGFGGAGKAFDAANSISVPSKDGNMQALDSVFSSHNRMMDPYIVNDDVTCIKGFGADLADENASYSMVMPTDQVWNDAQAKLTPLYNYAAVYEDKVNGDQGITSRIYLDVSNLDSLSALYVGADILTPLFGRTASGQETKLSNGTAYTVSEWPIPVQQYKPDVEVDLTGKNKFYFVDNMSSYYKVGDAVWYDASPLPHNITKKYGEISNGNFFYMTGPGPTSNPHVEVKLVGENGEQVMGGKYDVYVVMVPDWYRRLLTDSVANAEFLQDEQYFVDSVSAFSKMCLIYQIRYAANAINGRDAVSKKSSVIEYDGTKVDTIMIAQDFEFPYSYKNISRSYPTLIIDGGCSRSMTKNGFIYSLCIDKIILKGKEDGNEIEVTP